MEDIKKLDREDYQQRLKELGVQDPRNKFRFISKCFDVCVQSFMDKHFNPFERECMMQCLQNVITSHVEMASSLETVKDTDYTQIRAFTDKTKDL